MLRAMSPQPSTVRWAATTLTCIAISACAPPPAGDGASAVEILFPYSTQDDVFCPTMIVVVDVDGFTLSPEGIDGDEVDGEGHWHLLVNGEYITNSTYEYLVLDDSIALAPGRTHTMQATLRSNQHQELDPDVSSRVIEFQVEDSSDCLGGVMLDPDTGS